jgi:phage-related protein
MLKETFYIDGVDARSVGIHLQNPIEFSEPVPIVKAVSIPGRNGDLINDTGAFKNRTGTANCFAMTVGDVGRTLSAINNYLFLKLGYRRLETSDDLEHYWMARVKSGARIEQRLRTVAPFKLLFDCKPQRFLKSGEEKIVLTDRGYLNNPHGQAALPLITLYGSGSGGLSIGDRHVEIKSIDGILHLDSDMQNAYNDKGNQNMNINAPEFPILENGINHVYFSGDIERIEITPRWWEL